ncbi:LytTR family DNA-binding domain-containing protein [Clostridiaceae bacterium M8S5]|nr:LytTR family DNA-binding domain-containing protein [Clostridiaceae bacterium M8S5]
MLNICICDDEKTQRKKLLNIIETQMQLKGLDYNVIECNCGEALIKDTSDKHIDIFFLDIEMNNINGIDTAKKIREYNNTSVIIFVTGFRDYVFDGYDVKALNYVLKPYTQEKIINVIGQSLKQLEHEQNKFYVVQTGKELYKLNFDDIKYFTSNKRKVTVHTKLNLIEFYEKLDNIEIDLQDQFIRTHQRYLINPKHIISIENNFINLENERIPISKRKYQEVMISFAKHMLE